MLKRLSIVPLALALILGVGAAKSNTRAPAPMNHVRNIVLVHGAFADGSSYAKVIPLLSRAAAPPILGHGERTPRLPFHNSELREDAMTATATSIVSPNVDRHIAEFLDGLNSSGGKPMEQLSPQDARTVLESLQKSVTVPLAPADISEKTINVDGRPLTLTIVRPAGVKGILPVFMFFHGGGWVLGDFPTHERLVRDLVAASGAVGVFPNYTRSPEARYPTAINQMYGATKWVAENGASIQVDGERLAVVGNSVGGNAAGVISLMAKDKGGPAIRLTVMMWPVTDANFETGSYSELAEGHFLSRNMMKWFWDNYAPDVRQRREIYASPLQATIAQLKGLPPTLIQVAENDVLRDEGEAYARKLDSAGVDVTHVRYDGLIHDWGLLNPISQLPGVRASLLQVGQALQKRLAAK